jgi:hypothetical protein
MACGFVCELSVKGMILSKAFFAKQSIPLFKKIDMDYKREHFLNPVFAGCARDRDALHDYPLNPVFAGCARNALLDNRIWLQKKERLAFLDSGFPVTEARVIMHLFTLHYYKNYNN